MPFAQHPVREPGAVREPLPGRLHRRVHRSTRGWFHTLHVPATALFDRPALLRLTALSCDDGLKMRKSLRNYPT